MPRPEGISQEELVLWHKNYEETLKELEQERPTFLSRPPPEVHYAGCWLKTKLLQLNCPVDLADRILHSVGQRQCFANDPWEPALRALENYKKGNWEEPGMELAKKIFLEKYGANPDPRQVIEDVKKRLTRPPTKEEMKELKESFARNIKDLPPNLRN